MPPLRTYSDGKNIYSVDMMLAYINSNKHPNQEFSIEEFIPQLTQPVWGDWSPLTVIQNMDKKKYAANAERIRKANLTYPIIITGKPTPQTRLHSIVDGYHRISRAHLEGKTTIKAYVFEKSLMNKFILDKDSDFVKVHQHMSVSDILELYIKRFC